MRWIRRPLLGVSAGLAAAWGAQAAPADGAEATGSVGIAARIERRVAVAADRPEIHLRPGEAVTVVVTVKARLAPGDRVAVGLRTPRADLPLDFRAPTAQGPLRGASAVGQVERSGIHRIPVTIALAASARTPVTLPLRVEPILDGLRAGAF